MGWLAIGEVVLKPVQHIPLGFNELSV